MCTNGINTGQFEQMIDQIDDHIKLERRWAHNLAHNASDAGFTTVGESSTLQCSCSTRFAQRSMTLKMRLMKMPKTQAA